MSENHVQREESAFADRGDAAAGTSNPYSEPRDTSPATVAAREPFGDSNHIAHENNPDADIEEMAMSAEDMAMQIIIHDDKPIENLPAMQAPELKLIGRCVSFCVPRTIDNEPQLFYFTGLVCSVTFTAVTLMHVNRYTSADFKRYITREKGITREKVRPEAKDGEPTMATTAAAATRGLPSHGYSVEGEVGVGKDGGLASTQDADALLRLDAAGSLAPAVQLRTEEEIAAQDVYDATEHSPSEANTRAMRRHNFRRCEDSIGPLPYVTFLRKSIHDVRFGRDPRSSFYALFQNPAREIEDMQYLRMFVRRYMVHTSEGNNPRQVPLYAFVTVRCGCPAMDRELVYRVAREELPALLKADKSIEKEKRRSRTRQIRQEQALQAYEAPQGIFSHTGVLYVTRLPQITFMTAIGILLFTVVFAVYLGVSMGVLNDPLMVTYERKLLRFFIPSIVVWAIAGVFIILHSISVRVPLQTGLLSMGMRCIWSLGGLACSAMVIAVLAIRLKNDRLYRLMSTADSGDLCKFYNHYRCSGFWDSCRSSSVGPCISMCAQEAGQLFADSCYPYLWDRVQLQLIPLIVFAAVLLCFFLYSTYMLWKLWSTSQQITSRLR